MAKNITFVVLAIVIQACAYSAEPKPKTAKPDSKSENIAVKATPANDATQLILLTPADIAKASHTDDPAREHALKMLLAKAPDQRQKPAPYLKLEKPDPLQLQRLLDLKEQPADKDEPVSANITSPKPKLSTKQ